LKIFFHKESVSFPLDTSAINNWIENAVFSLGYSIKNLSFVFCDDEYLKNINVKYLGHDYYTDVISFDYSTEEGLAGDVFISNKKTKKKERNRG
jgi:probable rRNA maturation factor